MKKNRLFWIVTNFCNLNCSYCYYRVGLEKSIGSKIDCSKVNQIIKQTAQFFNEVVFTGGEPLVLPEIFDLIKSCKNKGLKVSLLTNGVLLNKENSRKIANLKVDSVMISLDSLDLKVNNILRGQTRLVLKSINNLLKVRPKEMLIQIQQLITRKNISSIRPMVKFCQERKIDLWLNFLDIGNKTRGKDGLDLKKISNPTLVFLEKEVNFWIRSMNKPELTHYLKNAIDLIRGKKPELASCPMGSQNFVLDVDGNVYPCFLRKDLYLGNIYREELRKTIKAGLSKSNQFLLPSAPCVRLGCLCLTSS